MRRSKSKNSKEITVIPEELPPVSESIETDIITEDYDDILFSNTFVINKNIQIHIPSLGEILKYGEDPYFKLVCLIISTPKDCMVQLDDNGVDYESVSEFELFSQFLFSSIQQCDTSILFGELDFSKFKLMHNTQSGENVLYHEEQDFMIDRYSYTLICDAIREIHHLEKDKKKAGNTAAKDYMIKRARQKQKRDAKKKYKPTLRPLIVSLVNCPEYKYNYEGSLDMTIYRFYSSVQAVQKRINFNQIMSAIYAGTVSSKDINMKELNWLN